MDQKKCASVARKIMRKHGAGGLKEMSDASFKRRRYRKKLSNMRTFYSWDDMPWDFFVDEHVSDNTKKTRPGKGHLQKVPQELEGQGPKVAELNAELQKLSLDHKRVPAVA